MQIQVLFNQDPKDFLLSKYTDVFSCLGYYQENVKQLMDVGSGKEDTSGLLDDASLGFAFGSLLVVAVGGTFDHLHDGHKILLSMASFVAKSKLIIGVTGPELLTKKKFSEVLESYSDREASVRVFLRRVNSPRISVDCYEMKDVCGPTGYVKEIDGLVVSAETAKGAEFVNKFRSDKNWPTLQVITIKVVGDNDNADESFKGKLSSSDIREREYKKKYGH